MAEKKNYRLICSAGSKADLESMVNDFYFCRDNFVILENGSIFNKADNREMTGTHAIKKGCRWRFEMEKRN